MDSITFTITGLPGTYSTPKEMPWKKAIFVQAPEPSLEGKEIGLRLRFILPNLTPGGRPLDVDNSCEPVFSVLINHIGWFGKSRSNLQWWQATKEVGSEFGCTITIDTADALILPQSKPDYDHVYAEQLPKKATSQPLGNWAWEMRHQNHIHWIPQQCSLFLGFPLTDHNIGNISGMVKPTIDCLYPWLGGKVGDPDDPRIVSLAVTKSQAYQRERGVSIKLWAHGRDYNKEPVRPSRRTSSESMQSTRDVYTSKPRDGVIDNPCRPGTRKWIVCEGALAKKTVGEVQLDLESVSKGAGERINEYIRDLRSENKLDIRIDGEQLICFGHLS